MYVHKNTIQNANKGNFTTLAAHNQIKLVITYKNNANNYIYVCMYELIGPFTSTADEVGGAYVADTWQLIRRIVGAGDGTEMAGNRKAIPKLRREEIENDDASEDRTAEKEDGEGFNSIAAIDF